MTLLRGGPAILLLLIAVSALCIPAIGAPAGTSLAPGEIAIRQAHLDWIAFTTETEMKAAITYISPLYSTDMTRLNALAEDFREQEALIPATTSRAGFADLTGKMRLITAQFRNESEIQMSLGYGKREDLTLQVRAATTNNPYIEQKRLAYWNTRRTNQLADFDAWAGEAQVSLDTLKMQGFDTAAAQRTLDVIGSKRRDLAAALDAKSEDGILAANDVILPLTRELGAGAAEAQAEVSEAERIKFLVAEGYRAVHRADTINHDLTVILLDIGPAEPTLRQLKIDLAATDRMLATGNLPLAQTPLLLAKKDLKDLSMAYRNLANTADLPPELTATLRGMVITLDNTADRMEAG